MKNSTASFNFFYYTSFILMFLSNGHFAVAMLDERIELPIAIKENDEELRTEVIIENPATRSRSVYYPHFYENWEVKQTL